jgi:hypothetical protein
MISKSAPRPVILDPTPAAKYSPPLLVSHLPAALLSADIATSSKICLYCYAQIFTVANFVFRGVGRSPEGGPLYVVVL